METVICDISALRFWRTPPVVRMLAAGQIAGTALEACVPHEGLARLQEEIASTLPLCRLFLDGARWRRLGRSAHDLRDIFLSLAPCLPGPVDILTDKRGTKNSDLIRYRYWTGELAPSSIISISDEVSVASPAFALQQVLARSSWVDGLMLSSELCGSFAVYDCPAPIRRFVTGLLADEASRSSFCSCSAWSPCLDGKALSGLWSRLPLVEPFELFDAAEASGSARGRSKLREVAGLVKPGAASPLEVQAGILLGLSRHRGGEGFGEFEYNKRVSLSPSAQVLAQRSSCVCDLYYDCADLDIECQSRLIHDNAGSLISDFDRSAALREMGINVLFASADMLASPRRFHAFADLVADELGVARPRQTDAHRTASANLRAKLFCDWRRLI